MNREGTVWQIADEAELVKAFRGGFSVEQIARDIGRTPSSIVTRLVRLHLLIAHDDGYYPVVNPVVTFGELRLMQERFKKSNPDPKRK